jgi:hypothetical protein
VIYVPHFAHHIKIFCDNSHIDCGLPQLAIDCGLLQLAIDCGLPQLAIDCDLPQLPIDPVRDFGASNVRNSSFIKTNLLLSQA